MTRSVLILLGLVATGADIPGSRCPDPVECIALAVYAEARGEPMQGQIAVAEAVLARGGEPCVVVAAPGQFEGIERMPVPRRPWLDDPKAWATAQEAARTAIAGEVRTECAGATHFYAHAIASLSWAESGRACVIGAHTFITME